MINSRKVSFHAYLNTEAVTYRCTSSHLLVSQSAEFYDSPRTLALDRQTQLVQQVDPDTLQELLQEEVLQEKTFSMFLGVADYESTLHLVFVHLCYPAFEFEDKQVYEVQSMEVIESKEGVKDMNLTKSLTKYMQSNFYYSLSLNITQRLSISKEREINPHRFYDWNKGLMKTLPSLDWRVYLTAGFFRKYTVHLENQENIEIIVAARKSTQEGHCFPHNFGVNDFGECAHYVTYELLVTYKETTLLYKYSTSTPPLDLSIGQDEEVNINCSPQKLSMKIQAFLSWLRTKKKGLNTWILARGETPDSEFSQYHSLISRLIEQTKDPKLTVWQLDLDELDQIDFEKDFYGSKLEQGFKKIVNSDSFFNFSEMDSGIKSAKQSSKSHLHFTMFSIHHSAYFLHTAIMSCLISAFPIPSSCLKPALLSQLLEVSSDIEYRLLNVYDRGRAKSLSPENMMGKMAVPNVPPSRNANETFAGKFIKAVHNAKRSQYKSLFLACTEPPKRLLTETSVLALSWNVGGLSPSSFSQVSALKACLDPSQRPDIITVGLQEVVELSSAKIESFFSSRKSDRWAEYLQKLIQEFDSGYRVVEHKRMVGLFSITFVHKEFSDNIYSLGVTTVKTGFMGVVGNKGSIVTGLQINDSTIYFCNTHLPPGDSLAKRSLCIQELYDEYCVDKMADALLLFGDLNMRVQLPLNSYQAMMEDFDCENDDIDFDHLRAKDEVKLHLHPCLFKHFEEAELTPLPTYRFEIGTSKYSSDRVASWCDRIFYYTAKDRGIFANHSGFSSLRVDNSDHWPVFGLYRFMLHNYDNKLLQEDYYKTVRGLPV